jgi:hypothetical protein
MSRPWRVNTIGDPLMLAAPPKGSMRRLTPPNPPRPGDTDVQTTAVRAMRAVETTPTDQAFADAIGEVCLLGRDQMAATLWEAAVQRQGAGPAAAAAAFGALFRQGERAALLAAWTRLSDPSPLQGDMLWAAFGPSLGEGSSDDVLHALSQAISPGAVLTRTARLLPLLSQRYGSGAAVAMLQRAESMASTQRQRRLLAKLHKRIAG